MLLGRRMKILLSVWADCSALVGENIAEVIVLHFLQYLIFTNDDF